MLDPVSAFDNGQIDEGALGQLGYHDSDADGIPDPIDTAPAIALSLEQHANGRPSVQGIVSDEPHPTQSTRPTTINTIAKVEYRADGGAWTPLPTKDGAYGGADEQIATTLPLYDGNHSVDFRAVNSIGAASPLFSRNVTVAGVGAQPDYQANVQKFTNSTTITMTLAAPAGATIQISEDPFFTGATWVPVQASASWQIKSADGGHTLYFRFRDSAGIESPLFARTILLDRTAPKGAALIHGNDQPWVELLAQDDVSGVVAVQISDETQQGAWQPFQPTMPLAQGAKHVEVRFRDAAGNISAAISARNSNQLYLPLVGRP
jgi:hypothetical protein